MKQKRESRISQNGIHQSEVSFSNDQFSRFLENAREPIVVVQDERFLFVNRETTGLLHFPLEEMLSAPMVSFVHPDDRELIRERILLRNNQERPPRELDFRILTREGEPLWLHAVPLLSEWNGVPAHLVHLQKITAGTTIENTFTTQKEGSAVFFQDTTLRKKAEIASEKERLLLRTLVDHLPISVFVKDNDFRKTAINKTHLERISKTLMRRVEEKEVLGKTDFDLYPEETARTYYEEDREVIREGKKITGREEVSTGANGEIIWELISKIPLRDPDGKIIGMVGIAEDISEQKRTENEIRQKSSRLASIVETSADAIAAADFNGTVTFWSQGAERIYGIPESAIVGKSILPSIPPERRNDISYFIEQTKAGKKLVSYETERIRPDGTRFYVSMNVSPFPDVKGEVKEFLVIVHDITERYLAQEILKKSEEKFRLLAENAGDVIWTIDINETLLYISPSVERLLGYTPEVLTEEWETLALNPVGTESFRENFIPLIERIKAGEHIAPVTFIKEFIKKEGQRVFTESRISCIFDDHGVFLFFLGVTRDITERKKAEDEIILLNQTLENRVRERTSQLEIANKDLESFAYSVSHDLRSPLRHIDGFSRLLRKELPGEATQSARYLDKISQATTKMATMIDELLNFSRLGRTAMKKSVVDLHPLVKQIIDQYPAGSLPPNIRFEIDELPVVEADPSLLQIVFENLISNAIKFSSKKESPLIEIRSGDNLKNPCTVYIRDNGAGFDNAYTDKLFGVFQRLHTTEEFEGTGIGLANVKQIIKKHGGQITADGKTGEGATFYLTL